MCSKKWQNTFEVDPRDMGCEVFHCITQLRISLLEYIHELPGYIITAMFTKSSATDSLPSKTSLSTCCVDKTIS